MSQEKDDVKLQKYHELASRRLDSQIPWHKKMSLTLHLLICGRCRRYVKQLKFLQKAFIQASERTKTVALSDEARQRIKQKLQDAQEDQAALKGNQAKTRNFD